jgi:hypothetical protein
MQVYEVEAERRHGVRVLFDVDEEGPASGLIGKEVFEG